VKSAWRSVCVLYIFGCLPVADIVKRRTAKFLKKYKEANDNNIVCQACIRYWL